MNSDALRADLAPYTLASVEDAVGSAAMAAIRREQRVPALEAARARGMDRAALLTRLLWLGDALTPDELRQAVPATVAADPEAFAQGRAPFQIVPVAVPGHVPTPTREVWIASDWGELAGTKPADSHVMPVGGATRTLAALANYEAGQRVLDIGTGCGYHAIVAALCGAEVTATDVSARALEYARLNAELAGVSIACVQGSLLEPAEGLYDVVVSNPPFVITPDAVRGRRAFEYRDGGMEGDSLLARLVADLPGALAPGGRAWLLGNWEIRDSWRAGPASWVNGLDAWVVQREELEPEQYVEMWLRDGGLTPTDPAYEELYAGWLKDFRARGVNSIGMGYLCLGMPEAANAAALDSPLATVPDASHARAVAPEPVRPWQRFERLSGPAPLDLHGYVDGIWASRHVTDAELIEAHPVAHAVEHRIHVPGQADPFLIKLAQIDGFAEELQVSSNVAAVIGACDGEASLGVLCDALASITGDASADVRSEVVGAARELLELGMLRLP